MRPTPRSFARRAARVAAVATGVLLAALIAVALYVRARAATLVHARAVEAAEKIGARIGRKVTVGPALVDLGRELVEALDDVKIAAAEGHTGDAAAPLFEVAAVRVRVAAWPLLRSRGKEVDVIAIDVRSPVVRLARLPGGELSYADVVAKLASPVPRDRDREVRVGRVTITGARIELADLAPGGARLAIEKIDAIIPAIRPDAPLDLALDAAVLAPVPNLHLDLRLAPEGAPKGPLGRVQHAAVRLSNVAIDPLAPFLPTRDGYGVLGATLSADALAGVDQAGSILVQGSVSASSLRLVHDGAPLGPPIEASIRADLGIDPVAPAIDARSFAIEVAGMTLEGRADVRGPALAPEVRALSIRARDVTFERLLVLAPPTLLPKGVSLSGPIAIEAEASGAPRDAAIKASIDLGGASITLPQLHKPAGTALSAELAGRAGEGGLTIDALGLRVGPLAISLRGRVRSAADVDLAFDSGEVGLDQILRLFPAVAREVPPGVALAGSIRADGHVKRTGAETRADAKIALRDADVKTKALTLIGAADLSARVRAAPGTATITFDLGADRMRAVVPGKLDKPAGSPLSVHALVDHGAVTMVRDAKIAIAGAKLIGAARHDASIHALSVQVASCDLDLAALGRAIPALAAVPALLAGARIHASGSFEGDLRDLAAGHLRLDDLSVVAPLGKLNGTIDLAGLSPPRTIAFDLTGEGLDLDHASGGKSGPEVALSTLLAIEGRGKLRVDKLHARGLDARDVVLDAKLDRGAFSLDALRLSALGGTLVANGSRVDLRGAAPSFVVRAKIDRLDLAALAASRGDTSGDLKGRLGADVSLDGAGASFAHIAPRLTGTLKVDIVSAHVHTMHTIRGTIVNPLLAKAAKKKKEKEPVREIDMAIERATSTLHVGGGRLSTTSMFFKTEDGTVDLSGSIGFDRSYALLGTVVIPPAVIEKSSKGKLVPFGDVTVRVRVDSSPEGPRIELVDLGSTVASLLGARMHGIVKRIMK